MQRTYEGAARRLARVLELSDEATKEVAALRHGKRVRQQEKHQLADELSKALASHASEPDRNGS
ncbi:MAG TPA: hypothetical protein VFC24_15105 [Casimicrobiaceae bacterium]|nr:hypothetical protein [Casimicrobiaceae bacterium]